MNDERVKEYLEKLVGVIENDLFSNAHFHYIILFINQVESKFHTLKISRRDQNQLLN